MPPTTTYDLTALGDRTLALAQAGEDMHRRQARTLLGLPPRRLALAMDEGTIVPSRTRLDHVTTQSLCSYIANREAGVVTLFDALARQAAAVQGQVLTEPETRALLARLHEDPEEHGLPVRTLRQPTMPPVTPLWEQWYQGHIAAAVHGLDQWQQDLLQQEREAAVRARCDAARSRLLWVAQTPLTPYQCFLAAALSRRVAVGQQVRVLDSVDVRHLEHGGRLPEVEVYVSGVIVVHTHTQLGRPIGALQLHDEPLAQALIGVVDELLRMGQKLAVFAAQHMRGRR
ncbi:DUF6879 family protein [Nocardiopsis alborubida]|uniref:DUF6879 domain-containing protein n=1 Tax=Nocardiopsis alborubida TaxID=146802 RepID=A0A7X6MBH8_9ACTN|nr:DUF6879 family protein [Nocardiopsis alborubida]NKY96705.1 hypothetical protein [Nocardiopsis alborubida]